MELDNSWTKQFERDFKSGQCFVILCRDYKELHKAFTALYEAVGDRDVVAYISSHKIRHTPSHAEIVFCTADDQMRLRGIRRDYKLIDPVGLAIPEISHRFR